MKNYKRHNFFIKKEFQGKLILGYFLFVLGGVLFFLFLLSIFSADTLTISYSNNDLQLGRTPLILLKKTLTAHWIFVVNGGICIVLASMLLTHRIAGPIFKIEKALDKMKKRNISEPIHLREKDEGKDLVKKINDFNLDLSQSIRKLHTHSGDIADFSRQLREEAENLPSADADEIQSLLLSLEEENKKIDVICSSYTIRNE